MSIQCCEDKSLFYSPQEVAALQRRPLPRHVAIIMDGNRRWVKRNSLAAAASQFKGHWVGAAVLADIVEAADALGIEVLTVFAFSTENWSRSEKEIEAIFSIIETYLKNNCEKMCENGVRFDVIGDLTPFPSYLKKEIARVKEATQEGKKIDLVIALNYGSRDEMRRVVTKIAEDYAAQKIKKNAITEEFISEYLDTARWGDPDLLIRTSGEMRISNFMLWQMAYAEMYVTDVLWPDFTPDELLKAVKSYQERQRRMGK